MPKKNLLIQTIYSGPIGPHLPGSGFSNDPIYQSDFIPTPTLRPNDSPEQVFPLFYRSSRFSKHGFIQGGMDRYQDYMSVAEYEAMGRPDGYVYGSEKGYVGYYKPAIAIPSHDFDLLIHKKNKYLPNFTSDPLNFYGTMKELPGSKIAGPVGTIIDFTNVDTPKDYHATTYGLGVGATVAVIFKRPVVGLLAGYFTTKYLSSDQYVLVGTTGHIEYYTDAEARKILKDKGALKNTDPLILDLSGNNKIDLISIDESRVLFDMNVNGLLELATWVYNGDGILVLDKNNDGIINSLSEVFSEVFDPRAETALSSLKLLDHNQDNKLNSSDEQFHDVQVWIDANTNGITDAGELHTLSELNITEIDLNSATVDIEDEHGNITQAITSATKDGNDIRVEEVALLVNTTGFTQDENLVGVTDPLGNASDVTYYVGDDDSVLGVSNIDTNNKVSLSSDQVSAYISGPGHDTIITTGTNGVVINGGAGDDFIQGSSGDDILIGGPGADEFRGMDGDDTLITDITDIGFDGGDGQDTLIIETEDDIPYYDASRSNIEIIFSGSGNDKITTTKDEVFFVDGGAGNDNLSGAAANDTLIGGVGDDLLNGNDGIDTATYNGNKSDFIITNNNGTWTVTDNRSDVDLNLGTDTLTNIERIRFNDEVLHTDNTNNNPIVIGGQMTTRGNQPLTITSTELLNTATDIDGDYLTITQIGNPQGGSASIDKDGNVIFTPQEHFTGKASFDYTVDDGHAGTATGTATITILPDLPTDTWFDDQWYLKAANIIPVWDDYTGAGTRVGILDDGVTAHSDLSVNPESDTVKLDYIDETSEASLGDDGTHGTFLAGLIAGMRNGEGVVGVAYDAMVKAYIAYGDQAFARQYEVDISNNSTI